MLILALIVSASPAMAQNATNESVVDGNNTAELTFGQQIAVIVSAQQAEVRSEIENKAFEYRFEQGNKSETVTERVREIHEKILEFKREKAELREKYRNGNLSRQEYIAKKTRLSIKANTTNKSLSQVTNKTESMNQSERTQVNFTAINILKNEARNMTGPEVARVAHTIAGRAPPHAGPPEGIQNDTEGANESDSRGPPGDIFNDTDSPPNREPGPPLVGGGDRPGSENRTDSDYRDGTGETDPRGPSLGDGNEGEDKPGTEDDNSPGNSGDVGPPSGVDGGPPGGPPG